MYDTGKIVAGLVVFVALMTFPLWYNVTLGEGADPPDLPKVGWTDNCVDDIEVMRASHMDLLDDWRNAVVRDGDRTARDLSGRPVNLRDRRGNRLTASLTNTCLACHTDRARFCDACHTYAGVVTEVTVDGQTTTQGIDCWDCHNNPSGGAN